MSNQKEHRRKLLVIVRVVVSAALLGYVLFQADLPSFVARWPGISQPLLVLALALQLAGIFISSLKWWLLLRAAEQPVAYLWTVRTYLVGQFFSNFLPTSIGGDAVRVFRLNQLIGQLGLAIASVFVERISGFLALTIIGWSALGLNLDRFDNNWQLRWAMIWGLLAASGGLLVALSAPWTVGLLSRLPLPNVIDWRGKLRGMADALAQFYADRGMLALVVLLAFVYQISWIGVNVAAAQALIMEVPWSFIALMVPISDIVGLIPIFFNNLGAREGIYTLLLGLLGVVAAQALALSLLVFSSRLLVSLLGGVVLLLESAAAVKLKVTSDK
ncbi:MAG: lysylphosphatidylglycerol synthase transmembrane domain-containing protein [Roseiflexaceae bacterium]